MRGGLRSSLTFGKRERNFCIVGLFPPESYRRDKGVFCDERICPRAVRVPWCWSAR
ncbi:hypothetical protein TENDBA_0435a [Treponema pallidum subsp. endemicum str. Bosnia A]|uniref:Uncharacterized protein n=1 Tax=Treponema pallidum subsp. endemicum str. Bosnia A TaxID=1155776 RepID=A0AAU8RNM4_TREPL|nr:hypothetical protein TENDBA_0435a [Treponema pallidum subsp. endemicum str. Bosnia A]QBC41475.1 hypothetical protein TENDIB_0435a [Treponema pallidum subsp. endemicum]